MGNQKSSSHKGLKKERQVVQTSLRITADERTTGIFLDIDERKARARPRPHQPVPSQYRVQ